jgi:FixJ family two-component response regulator
MNVNLEGQGRLLIVDDETAQMRALCDTLAYEGYETRGFDSPVQALTALRAGEYDLLLTDLMMPGMDGIGLIEKVREIDPDIGAIVMTGHGTIDTAVQAMRGGALDYILKPFKLNTVLPVLSRALYVLRLRRENQALHEMERRQAEELATAYRDLESFSYSISHDLRGPLLFVKDFAQRLKEDYAAQLGEEGGHIVQIIHDGTRSLDEMIVGLLAFSPRWHPQPRRDDRRPARVLAFDPPAAAAVTAGHGFHRPRRHRRGARHPQGCRPRHRSGAAAACDG